MSITRVMQAVCLLGKCL